MAIEQERRFLVQGAFPKTDGVAIAQGYLSTVKERTVRVRTKGDKAFITVKGETDAAGRRLEFEYEIPLTDAQELLGICAPYPIEKTRYHVNDAGFSWEIDEFHGHNDGLVIAEIEGTQEVIDGALKARPAWLGEDVTTSFEYANARLSERPFTKW
jgi:CYTH domain-containing protein